MIRGGTRTRSRSPARFGLRTAAGVGRTERALLRRPGGRDLRRGLTAGRTPVGRRCDPAGPADVGGSAAGAPGVSGSAAGAEAGPLRVAGGGGRVRRSDAGASAAVGLRAAGRDSGSEDTAVFRRAPGSDRRARSRAGRGPGPAEGRVRRGDRRTREVCRGGRARPTRRRTSPRRPASARLRPTARRAGRDRTAVFGRPGLGGTRPARPGGRGRRWARRQRRIRRGAGSPRRAWRRGAYGRRGRAGWQRCLPRGGRTRRQRRVRRGGRPGRAGRQRCLPRGGGPGGSGPTAPRMDRAERPTGRRGTAALPATRRHPGSGNRGRVNRRTGRPDTARRAGYGQQPPGYGPAYGQQGPPGHGPQAYGPAYGPPGFHTAPGRGSSRCAR